MTENEISEFVNLKFNNPEHLSMFEDLCKEHNIKYMAKGQNAVIPTDRVEYVNNVINPILEKMVSDNEEKVEETITLTDPFEIYLFDKFCSSHEEYEEDEGFKMEKEIKVSFKLSGNKLHIEDVKRKWDELDIDAFKYQFNKMIDYAF
jgi:hypothetical protein